MEGLEGHEENVFPSVQDRENFQLQSEVTWQMLLKAALAELKAMSLLRCC